MKNPVDLQAGPHQGDDHHEFGEALSHLRIVHRQGAQGHLRQGEHHGAEADADDRQRKRQALQGDREPRHQGDENACAGQGDDIGRWGEFGEGHTAKRRRR